jgi:hypothetical protein
MLNLPNSQESEPEQPPFNNTIIEDDQEVINRVWTENEADNAIKKILSNVPEDAYEEYDLPIIGITINVWDDWPLCCLEVQLGGTYPLLEADIISILEHEATFFQFKGEQWCRILGNRYVPYICHSERDILYKRYHTALGHLRYASTVSLLERAGWWPNQKRD